MSPVTPVTFYTVLCDRCGASADAHSDYAAWSDEEGAIREAEDIGWYPDLSPGNRWFCTSCAPTCPECGWNIRDDACRDWTLA